MKKELLETGGKPIIGISTRTSYEIETSGKSRIKVLWDRYHREESASSIPDRRSPNVTYCVYYNYADDDHMGEYSCLIGEEVNDVSGIQDNFEMVRIPFGYYAKFTPLPGKAPDVIINAWSKIWDMNAKELGGKRSYQADYEIYTNTPKDTELLELEIYLGIKKL